MALGTQEALEQHWALDSTAAEQFAAQIDAEGQADRLEEVYGRLSIDAIRNRDANRQRLRDIFALEIDDPVIVVGACSTGRKDGTPVSYTPVFDYIDESRARNPKVFWAYRHNVVKPRTGPGWTGNFNDVRREVRQQGFDTYEEALERGIPVLTEITSPPQYGAIAPFATGIWGGAREVESTELRGLISAVRLAAAGKNGRDGSVETLRKAILTMRSNSEAREGSGVTIYGLAATSTFSGINSFPLTIGEGNRATAIIARGYDIEDSKMGPDDRQAAAFRHLGMMCELAVELDTIALIDGSHDVPKMLKPLREEAEHIKDAERYHVDNRLVWTLKRIMQAMKNEQDERITMHSNLRGLLAEVDTAAGDTDPNYVLTPERQAVLDDTIDELVELIEAKEPQHPSTPETTTAKV